MNRRDLIKFAGSAAATAALPTGARTAAALTIKNASGVPARTSHKRPNLLFILTDQLQQDTMAVYGNTQIKVPNLNRLASESVVFHNYYCTQPVCTPSRGTLLTGLWPHTHGEYTNNIPLKRDIPVLVEMLRPNEYHTAYFGKWHLGNEIQIQHGFDEFESTEDLYTGHKKLNSRREDGKPLRQHSGYYDFLQAHGIKPDRGNQYSREYSNSLPEELSKPAYLAGLAERFLDEKHEKPWVMYVSILDPHPPFNSAFSNMYDPNAMPVPETFHEKPSPTDLPRIGEIRAGIEAQGKDLSSEAALRKAKAYYWGKVSLVDVMVGRILKKLAETNQEEDTIIVFTTDHGEMMGAHHLMFKSVMYEESARVPLLLKIPGVHGHPGVQEPMSAIDMVPTLLDLLEQPLQPHLQGDSWAAYLKHGNNPPEKSVMIEWNGPLPKQKQKNAAAVPVRTIRTIDGWKMALTPGSAGELFNLNDDPKETKNLFYEDASLERVKRLAHEINLWQKSTGDEIMLFDQAAWTTLKTKLAAPAAA